MAEKHRIWIVLDASGSMLEGGKSLLARGVARAVEQYYRLGHGDAHVNLVAWNHEARIVDWNPDEDFPSEMPTSESTLSVAALITLFGKQPDSRLLLLTDGFWSREDAKALKIWQASLPPDALRLIKVGADADPPLQGAGVFAAGDLFAALDGWPGGSAA